jgi:NarL family two-component system response regulator LiaR
MQAIASGLDVPRIFNIVAQQAEHVLAHDALAVLLRPDARDARDADDAHELAVAFCNPPIVEAGRSWPLGDFSFGPALIANHPAIVTDFAATADQYAGDQLLFEQAGRAGVIVPIAATPHVLGGLVLISSAPGLHGPEDVPLVEPIANLLAVALEHRRLDERARALAVVEERNRLAREIHDTLAQSLAGIIINLESLKPYRARRSRVEADVLAETEILARGALEEARRSVMGLHPTPLQHQSLRDALTLELAGLAKRAALTTQFYVNGIERPLAPDLATALFRVAQEAFQNIYKHAAARHVILGLAFEEGAVVLTVEDDGVGFVPDAPGTTTPKRPLRGNASTDEGGFGLLSMAARAHILGGELLVTSHPGHGTAVRTIIPYVRSGIAMAAVVLPDALSETLREPSPDLSPDARLIRVLVVDDHSIVRQGIRRILDEEPDIEVVGEAENGLAAVEQVSMLQPDVVLLDLQLPGLSGIEALPRLRVAHPAVEVVILTVFDQNEEVFAGLKAGARGYLLKDATPATVIAAVRAARRGESSLAPALATRVMDRFAVLAQREVDPDALTEREMEILGCMAQGMPYKEIGAQLNITAKTVQYHIRNILQKLHVGSRGEAVAAATERGLLSRA